MAEARKLIETKKEGEFETKKFHVLNFDLDTEWLGDLFEDVMDDCECAYYSWGIGGDFDGDIFSIEVDTLLEQLNSLESELTEDYKLKDYNKLKGILKPYKGYTIYLQEKEGKN